MSEGQEFIVVVVMANDESSDDTDDADADADAGADNPIVNPADSVANFVENNLVEALVEQDLCSEENPCEVTSPVAPARIMEQVIGYVECSESMGESLLDETFVPIHTVKDPWYGCQTKCEDDTDCLAITYFFSTFTCKRYRTPCYWHESNEQSSIALNFGGESFSWQEPTQSPKTEITTVITTSTSATSTAPPATTTAATTPLPQGTTTAPQTSSIVATTTNATTPTWKEVTQRAATTKLPTITGAVAVVAFQKDGVTPGENAAVFEWYIVAVIVGLLVLAFVVVMFVIFRRFQSKSERKNSIFQVHKHTGDE